MTVTIKDTIARAKIGAGALGAKRQRAALLACVENIKSDTMQTVPKYTGNLRQSVNTSRGEEGIISWTAPYAAYVYHMKGVNWTTSGTCGEWVDVVANSGGLTRWNRIIQEILNG